MATTQSNQTFDGIQQVHEQFNGAIRRQAEQIDKLDQCLKSLQNQQRQLEEASFQLLKPLEKSLAGSDGTKPLSPSSILSGVRTLAAATYVDQVFEALAEEAAHMNTRSVVFDVRGRAAWGATASGFNPDLSPNDLRTLVVPLNHDGPFRRVFEAAESVETSSAELGKSPNLLIRLAPATNARILLLPIRSADAVTAVFYAETGERRDSTLVDALKVLAEFAGAQIDRLMVINGGLAAAEAVPVAEQTVRVAEEVAKAEPEATEVEATVRLPEVQLVITPETSPAEPSGPPLLEVEQTAPALPEAVQPAEEPPAPAEAADVTHPTEEEEKVHRDARRFSKLLVSEIELYNKNSVQEGRRNKDLYQRLKRDIDRSRETYEKRFAHTVASQVDYFHEELVRTLAENDPMLLGSDYPGPSV